MSKKKWEVKEAQLIGVRDPFAKRDVKQLSDFSKLPGGAKSPKAKPTSPRTKPVGGLNLDVPRNFGSGGKVTYQKPKASAPKETAGKVTSKFTAGSKKIVRDGPRNFCNAAKAGEKVNPNKGGLKSREMRGVVNKTKSNKPIVKGTDASAFIKKKDAKSEINQSRSKRFSQLKREFGGARENEASSIQRGDIYEGKKQVKIPTGKKGVWASSDEEVAQIHAADIPEQTQPEPEPQYEAEPEPLEEAVEDQPYEEEAQDEEEVQEEYEENQDEETLQEEEYGDEQEEYDEYQDQEYEDE